MEAAELRRQESQLKAGQIIHKNSAVLTKINQKARSKKPAMSRWKPFGRRPDLEGTPKRGLRDPCEVDVAERKREEKRQDGSEMGTKPMGEAIGFFG